MSTLIIFSGFFANSDSMPAAFSAPKYISPFYYAYQMGCINEFTDLDLKCPEGETCKDYLEVLGYEGVDVWEPAIALFIMTGAIRIIPMFVLMWKTKNRI